MSEHVGPNGYKTCACGHIHIFGPGPCGTTSLSHWNASTVKCYCQRFTENPHEHKRTA